MGWADGHELKKIVIVNNDHAKYYCQCGTIGTATYGSVLHTRAQLDARAKFNHSLHRVRAQIREGN